MSAAGKSEFGLYGVVGGMTVMAVLAFRMRQVRVSPEVVGRAASGRYAGCGIAAERVARAILPLAAINPLCVLCVSAPLR